MSISVILICLELVYYLSTRYSAWRVIVKGVNIFSGVKKLVFVIAECGLHMVSEVLECFTNLCTTENGIVCHYSSI